MRHRHVGVVRELEFAHQRPGRLPDPLLEPGARRTALDDLDEDHRRQRAEGARAVEPHGEGAARRGDRGQVRLDGRQRRGVDLGGRQERDVRGNAVRGRVAEARAAFLEQAAVRLRDRDRNAERYGPHVVLLSPCVCRWCGMAVVRCAGGSVGRFRPCASVALTPFFWPGSLVSSTRTARMRYGGVRGRPGRASRDRHARPVPLSASRAGSRSVRTPGRASPRRPCGPSPRLRPGSSPASPDRPDIPGCGRGTV